MGNPLNIAELIIERSAPWRERPALIHGGQAETFAGLLARADAIAQRLREILDTHCPGTSAPRIGFFCPNGADYVAVALAIVQAGGCLVPIPSELAVPEREELIRVTAQHLVISAGPKPWLPSEGTPESAGDIAWQWTAVQTTAAFPEDRFAALAPAFIRFSSGTTGQSKGVVLGHETLLARVESANRRLRISSNDRVLWTLPMAHHFAVSIVLYLLNGATTIIEDSHLASEVLDSAIGQQATVMYGSPFHYALLAAETSGRAWPGLRLAVATAAPLTATVAGAFRERFRQPLTQGLGIIECGLPLLNTGAAEREPLSVGRPDDVETQIRRTEGGLAEAGETGELWLRGPGFLDAYLQPWRERNEITEDGWFQTGDAAEQDEEGSVFLRGRTKSVINFGGMKFYAEQVEAALNEHPEVAASRVQAEPHERWHTVPVAEIIPRDPAAPPSGAALMRHCRERLAAYKTPVRFKIVDELPRTASGKIKR